MFLWLFIAHRCLRDHESQAGRSWSFLSTKDFAIPLHLPKRHSSSSPAQKITARVLHTGMYFFSFLDRAYFSPMIQRLGQPEPGRLVGLFLFCKQACVQGKSLNNKFRHSWCLHTDGTFAHPPPTVQTCSPMGAWRNPISSAWFSFWKQCSSFVKVPAQYPQPNGKEITPTQKSGTFGVEAVYKTSFLLAAPGPLL